MEDSTLTLRFADLMARSAVFVALMTQGPSACGQAGSLDTAFRPQFNDYVGTCLVQSDGKLLVGGDFTEVNGQPRHRIVRLNSDGSVDPTFVASFDGSVVSLVQSTNSEIIASGSFSAVNGLPRSRIARISSDGAVVNPDFVPGNYSWVSKLVVQSDGRVVFASSSRLIRLNHDGSEDLGFNVGVGTSQTIECVSATPGGLVIGGTFNRLQGLDHFNRVAKLNNEWQQLHWVQDC